MPYDPTFGDEVERRRRQALEWLRMPVYPDVPRMERRGGPSDFPPHPGERYRDMPQPPPRMERRGGPSDFPPHPGERYRDMPQPPPRMGRPSKQDALRQMAEERERWQRLPRALERPDDLDDAEREAMRRQLLDAYKRLQRKQRAQQMQRLGP